MSVDKIKRRGDSEHSGTDKHIRDGKKVLEKHAKEMSKPMPKKAKKKARK